MLLLPLAPNGFRAPNTEPPVAPPKALRRENALCAEARLLKADDVGGAVDGGFGTASVVTKDWDWASEGRDVPEVAPS